MTALQRLQDLFRELLQLDLADLDFGIYRLLRLKRDEVEAFLTQQLPRRVREEFAGVAAEEREALERTLADLAARIRTEIADDAILSDGSVSPKYSDMKARAARQLLDEYGATRDRLAGIEVTEAQQAEVFNHLYNFFSRYYEGGDFIPRRRYGAREAYAVPYNGEETFFYWANRDQHYVKTAEAFRDYAFTVDALGGTYRVRFALTQASVPPGNVKGETRYFFPQVAEIAWDAEAKTLRIPFHYRLPSEGEVDRYGKNARLQEAIIEEGVPKILDAVPDPVLKEALAQVVDRKEDEEVTLLKKRLRHFTRKQTTDYFIHKDLGGFLRRELEFYLKDQVLHVADLDGDLDAKRRMLRVVRELADEVITFLAQIEDAQKRLFEKRKFVLRTDYLVPIMHVPRELWPDVVGSQKQVATWEVLFSIRQQDLSEKFLENHPTLVVDTGHFGVDFRERLLQSFSDLDESTDALLIQAENYQALRLLQTSLGGAIACIYIDPPYNTGSDEFVFKDRYRHSTWLAMMDERVRLARLLLDEEGAIFVSIDDTEAAALKMLFEQCFDPGNFVSQVVVRRRKSQPNLRKGIAPVHDYLLVFARDFLSARDFRYVPEAFGIGAFSNPDNDPRGPWTTGPCSNRGGTPYRIVTPAGVPYEDEWRFTLETYEKLLEEGRIYFPDEGRGKPRYKIYLSEKQEQGVIPSSLWDNVGTTQESHALLESMFAKRVYDNPKPVEMLTRICEVASDGGDYLLDFFSGSGSLGHAVVNLNRRDGKRRKVVLVEMAAYFDSVLLPRLQKICYTTEWQEGRPVRAPSEQEVQRTPRLMKVVRLETYEDALHNVGANDTISMGERVQAHARELGADHYRLHYVVRLPLEASASMLAIERLERPFEYGIEVLTEEGPMPQRVDLVETFNFLYGLHVQQIRTWLNEADGSRSYRVVKGKTRDNRRVLVLWRDMTDLDPAVERRYLEPKIESEGPFDEMLINGDCAVPGVQSLDGLFKRLMEEGET